MARIDDDDQAVAPDVYNEMLLRERELMARVGHQQATDRGRVFRRRNGGRLVAFGAGRPVEVARWELPRWCAARDGGPLHDRVTVHPDGHITDK